MAFLALSFRVEQIENCYGPNSVRIFGRIVTIGILGSCAGVGRIVEYSGKHSLVLTNTEIKRVVYTLGHDVIAQTTFTSLGSALGDHYPTYCLHVVNTFKNCAGYHETRDAKRFDRAY